MIDWDFQQGKLTVTPHSLTVSALEDIWKFDKNRNKKKATALMKYVFFMCDIRKVNPLLTTPEKDKAAKARFEAFGNKDYEFTRAEKKLVDAAMLYYREYNENSPMRALFAIDKKIDQASQLLDDNNLTKENAASMLAIAEGISKMKKTRGELEKMVREEMENAKVRGNLTRSPRESGMFDLRKYFGNDSEEPEAGTEQEAGEAEDEA